MQVGINYECAKAIYRTYRLQDRKDKKGKRSKRLAAGQTMAPERREYFEVHRKGRIPRKEQPTEQKTEGTSIILNNKVSPVLPKLPSIRKLAGYR